MIGSDIYKFAEELWPIHRSLTGEGVRTTLKFIKRHLPGLSVHSVATGRKVFDWTVPPEWKVREAFIITPSGDKICDISVNNLHLVGYSQPFFGEVSLEVLKEHLYTLPEQPDAIPYVTSYYERRWGFCLSQRQYDELVDGKYYVHINTEIFDGELNYGEIIIKGKSSKEVFISTYICHPSMANNEISGPAVVTYLAKWLSNQKALEFTYRIIFIPETIGSITYLSINYKKMKNNVIAGFNVSCVGDDRAYSYLPSRDGNTLSDQVAKHILKYTAPDFKHYTWLERGSDERQYCAPGIDLPVASMLRSWWGDYSEYHTSLDDLINVVTPEGLNGGYSMYRRAIEAIERNKKYRTLVLCEPQMSKYGLYPTISTQKNMEQTRLVMNFISFCDGDNSLLDIAEKLSLPIWCLYELVDLLCKNRIIAVSDAL